MESSRPCKECGKKSLVSDYESGNLICSSCGVVQDFDNYQHQAWDATGPTGSIVRLGTSGSGTVYSHRDTKIYQAQRIVGDVLCLLNLETRVDEVNHMIKTVTSGEYGQGNWFPVLVGACIYVVMRKDSKPLPLSKVGSCIGCGVHELGRMVCRVVDFLQLKLPDFDVVELFARVLTNWSHSKGVGKEKEERMRKHGVFLIQCLIRWFVTTGRRPGPVVVAVSVFVAKLNEVDIAIEDLAQELNVAVGTCRLRYRELLERLVEVARYNLPWGKDVTVKNIMKNAPFVIQFMEIKSMRDREKDKSLEHVGSDLDGLIGECLDERDDFLFEACGPYGRESDSIYFDSERSPIWDVEDLNKLKVSHECLSAIYFKYLEEVSRAKYNMDRLKGSRTKKRRESDLTVDMGCFSGESELSKKLFLEQILDKDVGLNAMPPSFVTGGLAYQRRREKIKAAKLRIKNVVHPSDNGDSGEKEDLPLPRCIDVLGKKRKGQVHMDWEDFIVETLLLHHVKEEEIEKGYYNTLLGLHVFNSGVIE